MPRGRQRFTLDTSTSLPRHPSADGPLLTRGRSASASLVRVMRAESGHHVLPSDPTRQSDPSLPGNHLPALSLPPSHSPQTLLSLAKPWRSSPSSSLAIEALPRRSVAGERQEMTPTSYTAPISSSSLGRSFPQQVLLLLHLLLQAPSKEDYSDLPQAFPVALKPLPVSYSTPVSVSPLRSIPHCPRI